MDKVIKDWLRKIHTLEYACRYQSMKEERKHFYINLVVILCMISSATIYGATYIFDLFNFPLKEVLVFFFAIFASIMSIIGYFLDPYSKFIKYREASKKYEFLRHEIEVMISNNTVSNNTDEILKKWKEIEYNNVSKKNFSLGKKRVSELGIYGEDGIKFD